MQEATSPELAREAREALARCDVERLEKIVVECGRLNNSEAMSTHSGVQKAEFEAFAALLEMTRENMQVMIRPRAAAGLHLEYQPLPIRRQEGAMY